MAEESRAVALRLHDVSALAHATRISGMAAFYQNDLQRAVTLLEDALTHHQAAGDLAGVWIALLQLTVTTAVNDPERAVAFGEECLALSETRAHLSRSWALWSLGFGKWLIGDQQQAGKLIRESIRLDHRSDNQWGTAHRLEILAWIAAAEGEDEHAARLLGAAHKIWESAGTLPAKISYLAPSHAQCVKRARRALGSEKFTATFHEGIHLTLDQAIEATT